MLRKSELIRKIRATPYSDLIDGGHDGLAFTVHRKWGSPRMRVIVSWGEGWDHISISKETGELPSWYDLEFVRHIVAKPDEVWVQYSMPKERHITFHEVAHLWRCQTQEYPTPPAEMV